jgi:predicted GIY-YIG superfamily endonuclease
MKKDFSRGKIYKIVSPNTDKFYIGSTTMTLNQRFNCHKLIKSSYSRYIISKGEATIELIENFPCKSKDELRWRERDYYDYFLKNCGDRLVNHYKPIVSKVERTKRLIDNIYWKRSWGDYRYHNCLLHIKI